MPIKRDFGNFFKSEIKVSGFKLFAEEKVTISSGSDTDIQAYVRGSQSFKVRLASANIGNATFTAACTCPTAQKSQFCKHVWATLLSVERRYPDFLSAKQVIEKPPHPSAEEPKGDTQGNIKSDSKASYQETAKARASAYRKEQYQKQKQRVKDLKREKQGLGKSLGRKAFSAEVEEALAYFALNGFPMMAGPDEAIVNEAKKKLSRVFHPDKGGTTEEIVELNRNCELLLKAL